MKIFLLIFLIFESFGKLSKSEIKYKRMCKNLERKMKLERKLMIPLIIKKVVEKAGIHTYTHNFFKDMWGGINNIKMA